jgi:hypothetical protein
MQIRGLTPFERATDDRDAICTLYDEQQSVARRLRVVQRLMERPDVLAFVPSVEVFIKRHPPSEMRGEEKRLYKEIQDNEEARARVLKLARELDVSALQLELAQFAVHMGWMSRDEFRRLAIFSARHLLRRTLTSEVVDVMCEVSKHEYVGDQFGSGDIPEPLFWDPEGIRLITCLDPKDPHVTDRLAAALDAPDGDARLWAAHALTRRLPLSDPVLTKVANHLQDPSADVVERLQWVFRAQNPVPADVKQIVSAADPALAAQIWPAGGTQPTTQRQPMRRDPRRDPRYDQRRDPRRDLRRELR